MNLQALDSYLQAWDAFAQGDESLVPVLRKDKLAFRETLAKLLDAGDRSAPGRLVFYALVQVGGSIDVDSELGQAARRLLGEDFPTVLDEEDPSDQPGYFAGDLYFWWLKNASHYAPYALLDDWLSRDFAREVAIPLYESAAGIKD